MTMATKNEVAKTQGGEMAKPGFMKGTGRGSENVGADDITIPRLELIQAISPQRKKNDPEYIDGAEEGMFFNTVSKKLYGEELTFVPVYFRKEYIIWKSRRGGGGFYGAFSTEQEARDLLEANGWTDELDDKGNPMYEVVDTGQHFGIVVDDHTSENPQFEEIVISTSKSKMKASRALNTMVRMAGGDRFERGYKVSAFTDTNKQSGEEYMNLKFDQLGYVSEPVYRIAEKVYEAISGGAKDVNRDAA